MAYQHTRHTKPLKSYRTVSSSDKRRKVTVQTVKNVLNFTQKSVVCAVVVLWGRRCVVLAGHTEILQKHTNTSPEGPQFVRREFLGQILLCDKNTSLYMSKTGLSLWFWFGFDCGWHSKAEKKCLPLKNLDQLTTYWELLLWIQMNDPLKELWWNEGLKYQKKH